MEHLKFYRERLYHFRKIEIAFVRFLQTSFIDSPFNVCSAKAFNIFYKHLQFTMEITIVKRTTVQLNLDKTSRNIFENLHFPTEVLQNHLYTLRSVSFHHYNCKRFQK